MEKPIMRPTESQRSSFRRSLFAGAALAAAFAAAPRTTLADGVVYDHMTGVPATNWYTVNIPVSTAPTGTGNEYMGIPVTFAPSSNLVITGFDICWANATGSTITLDAAHTTLLRFRYWIWNR